MLQIKFEPQEIEFLIAALNSHSANPTDQYTPADGGIIVQLSGSITFIVYIYILTRN